MVQLVGNDAIEEHFRVTDYLPIAEEMYRQMGSGKAAAAPTETIVSKVGDPPTDSSPPVFHGLRTAGGSIKGMDVAAVRINSDLKHWPEKGGVRRQKRIPITDGRYNGLILLFSNETGELLLIFPDGAVQPFHVAGGIAVGAKYLARNDASVLGMYGCGHQADAHLPALAQACDLEEAKVYSPTRENREKFAAEMDGRLDLSVRAVEDPEEVASSADIINCATNSTEPVFDPSWIEPGTHIGSIRPAEFPIDILNREEFQTVVITKSEQCSVDITGDTISGHREETENAADPWRFFVADEDPLSPKLQSLTEERQPVDDVAIARLPNVVSGTTKGRTSDEEITVLRQVGHGIAFAAIGHALYSIAEAEGLGTEISSELLTQDRVP